MCFAEACNEFMGQIFASLHLGNTAPFEEMEQTVASRWQHYVWFDQPKIWTSDLPLQRRTRFHSRSDIVVNEVYPRRKYCWLKTR